MCGLDISLIELLLLIGKKAKAVTGAIKQELRVDWADQSGRQLIYEKENLHSLVRKKNRYVKGKLKVPKVDQVIVALIIE